METSLSQYYEAGQEIITEKLIRPKSLIISSGGEYPLFIPESIESLLDRLQHVTANFVIHDISSIDCPVIYYNDGFKELTGLCFFFLIKILYIK